jgi:hypothetical protein
MKKIGLIGLALLVAMSSVFTSCVNQEYDIEDLNTEMTIASGGIALPLGSTQKLRIKDFLDSNAVDFISRDESGALSLMIQDSLSLSESIPNLADMATIPGFELDASFSKAMKGLNGKVSVKEASVVKNFASEDGSIMDKLQLDRLQVSESIASSVADLMPAPEQLQIPLENMDYVKDNLFSKSALANLPLSDTEETVIPDGLVPDKNLETKGYQMEIEVILPEGIKSISEVTLNPDAKVICSVSVKNPFITKGSVIPAIDVDLSDIIEVDNSDEPIHLAELVLNNANDYTASKEYDITGFNIDESDWTGNTLKVTKSATISGKASLVGASTTKQALEASQNMKLELHVTFADVNIDNISMEIEPIEISDKITMSLAIPEVKLPEQVKSVGNIYIDPLSSVQFSISPENMVGGLDLNMETLKFAFPKGMKVEEADANGIIVAEHVDLSSPYSAEFHISSITPDAPQGGLLSYDGQIEVQVDCSVSGIVDMKSLPADPSEDMAIETKIDAQLKVKDCEVTIDEIVTDITGEDDFVVEFPGGMLDFGTFSLIPEGSPEITLDVDVPSTSLNVSLADEGLMLTLPEMFVLGDVDSDLNYDPQTNTLVLKGGFPMHISLPIEKLVVTPKTDKDGVCTASGRVGVNGAITIPSASITGSEMDVVMTEGISVQLMVPSMELKEIEIDELSFDLSQKESFTILSSSDLPAEIISISNIDIAATELKIDLNVNHLPAILKDSPINLDLKVTLPDQIVPNVMTLEGEVKDGKFTAAFPIEDLDLSGIDFSAGEDFKSEISIDGRIFVKGEHVKIDDIKDDVIKMDFVASLSDINILKIEADVDFQMEQIQQSISLSELPDFLKSENVCLDLYNPYIVLEVTTNVGIPIKGTMNIKSFKEGGEPVVDAFEFDIELPYSESKDVVVNKSIWIGGDEKGVPADAIFVKGDIAQIIKSIPDVLEITIDAGTDASKTSVIETTADYILDVNYRFVLPLAFGEDMKLELSDTLDVSEAGIGEILKMGEIHLVGEVVNSLPLQFEMNLQMLDESSQPMNTEDIALKIASCSSEGTPSETSFKLVSAAKDGENMTRLKSLKVSFIVTSGKAAGVPVTDESFVQANIGVNIPKGINISFGE